MHADVLSKLATNDLICSQMCVTAIGEFNCFVIHLPALLMLWMLPFKSRKMECNSAMGTTAEEMVPLSPGTPAPADDDG